MRLTTRGKYAVDALLYMLKNDDGLPIKTERIAYDIGLSHHYITQLLWHLKKGGVVTSHKGGNGGYKLARVPEKITLMQIFNAVNENVNFTGENFVGLNEVIKNYLNQETLATIKFI